MTPRDPRRLDNDWRQHLIDVPRCDVVWPRMNAITLIWLMRGADSRSTIGPLGLLLLLLQTSSAADAPSVSPSVAPSASPSAFGTVCSNSCDRIDDECDDGAAGAEFNFCDFGTDCHDCGTRIAAPPPPVPAAPSPPAAPPPYCLRITTSTSSTHSGANGDLDVILDSGGGFVTVASAGSGDWNFGEVVLNSCYTIIVGLRVTNPTTDGWLGSIEYSSDGGESYGYLECSSCNGGTITTASIWVGPAWSSRALAPCRSPKSRRRC